MLVSLMPTAAFATNSDMSFTDVKKTDWFYEAVKYAYENGLMNGTGDNRFSPNATITRGMIVTILYRMEGEPATTGDKFSDVVADQYYADAVAWASANAIVEGYGNGKFGPDDPVTREQLATILYRYVQYKGYASNASGDLAAFADGDSVSDYAVKAMKWAVAAEIIKGTDGNRLAPNGTATRAEAATMLMRFCMGVVPTEYAVTFKYNYEDKGVYVVGLVAEGETVGVPTTPEREGYTFDGWYTTADCSTEYDFAAAVTAPLTLYAKWTAAEVVPEPSPEPTPEPTPDVPKTYTVTFEYNLANQGTYKTIEVEDGNTVEQPGFLSYGNYYVVGWYTEAAGGQRFDFDTPITSDVTLYAKWREYITTPTTPEVKTYTVTFDANWDAVASPEAQVVKQGEYASWPTAPQCDGYQIVGWFLDPRETDWTKQFLFYGTPIIEDITLYAIWVDVTTDTDNDGLPDELEQYINSDINNADTDGDGLTDYQEVIILGTNPLKADSDDNGISDFDEDIDEDGISNGEELLIGTNPLRSDTDGDGLSDYDEINVYNTVPTNADTDGDGGQDGWEVSNGFDPLVYNDSFAVSMTAEQPTAAKPVTAGVNAEICGNGASTLEVQSVGYADNPMISTTIAGYLGKAYSFKCDGSINGAELVFRYDVSMGTIGDDFQPRIYYYNEETCRFEELADQTVTEGEVRATVEHFSTYILLNKVEFDKVWDAQIKPPSYTVDETAKLDIVFVIDYSYSMVDNDKNYTFKDLSKSFVSKLRDDIDKAAVVKFIKGAKLVQGLTTDKTALNNAIDSIQYDSGHTTYSGTDGTTGLNLAINELLKSEDEYRYIVFITDGADTQKKYSYDTLIETAANNDIVIYTVGMGNSSDSILQEIAAGTGGNFYKATTGTTEADNIVKLGTVFEEIQNETVDYITDSNHDGISDYYTDMIYQGKLVLSNGSYEFAGVDFNYDKYGRPSNDYDGDGLLNGSELVVTYDETTGKVYMIMKSDPMKKHSDNDGIDDFKEIKRGSDPLYPDIDGNSFGVLTSTEKGYYYGYVDLYDNDLIFKFQQNVLGEVSHLDLGGLVLGKTRFGKVAATSIIDYFYKYGDDEFWEKNAAQKIVYTATEKGNEIIGKLFKYIGTIKKGADSIDKVLDADALEEIKAASEIIKEWKGIGDALYENYMYDAEWWEKGVVEAARVWMENVYVDAYNDVLNLSNGQEILGELYLKIEDFSDKYKSFMDKKVISDISISDTYTLLKTGKDAVSEIIEVSKINAAREIFEENFDILNSLRYNAKYDAVSKASDYVISALGQSTTDFYRNVAEIVVNESAETIANELAKKVLKGNPIYEAFNIAKILLEAMGIDSTTDSVYEILTYNDLREVVISICKAGVERVETPFMYIYNGTYYFYRPYSGDCADTFRYLTHSAQIDMLAEHVGIEMDELPDYNVENAKGNIESTLYFANYINLPISKQLIADVDL